MKHLGYAEDERRPPAFPSAEHAIAEMERGVRGAARELKYESAMGVAIKNLRATELAELPSIAHVIRSLEDALANG